MQKVVARLLPIAPLGMVSSLWQYRGFIRGAVVREFQTRYRNSLFGGLWTIINPLAMILIYTLIFSKVMQTRLPGVDSPFAYSIFLMSGMLPWNLFIEILGRCQTVFLENAGLIKKISFPKICLPVIVLLNCLINFAIVYTLFLAFLVLSGQFPGSVVFAVIPVLALQIALAIGLGMIIGVLNVFFRDVGQFFTIFLQFWFWLTPVVYSITLVPDMLYDALQWNPMTPVVVAYQTIFLQAKEPDWFSLWPTLVLAIALNALGWRLFRKHQVEMVDEL
jgi:lipopolysaccharide transport system permease protein